jgi:hypothetical protein
MAANIRKANLNTDLATLTAMSTEYRELTSRTQTSSSKVTELQGKIQALKAKTSDIANATSTYEKEFLDRKQGAPIAYKRLQTLQDIVLAAFFFSYLLISLAFIVYIWRTSVPGTPALMYAGTTAFIMTILGVVLAEVVRRYA